MKRKSENQVHISKRDTVCIECKESIKTTSLVVLMGGSNVICLSCADLDHLVYLPSGNAALTRRATKHSKLTAVVYEWSSARKRNERQGILVDKLAIEKAEAECLSDEDARAIRRKRDAERRAKLDEQYIAQFEKRILELFPSCSASRAAEIAEHACEKYSGRIGRSSEAKNLSSHAVELAVVASIRHRDTDYDERLNSGWSRDDARDAIREQVDALLHNWSKENS